MPETFLMIVLTLMNGGGLSAAFSSTPDKSKCEMSAKMVGKILTKGGYKISQIGCYKSSQSFSPYEHGVPDDVPRKAYFIRMTGDSANIISENGIKDCQSRLAAKAELAGTSALCVTSTQTLKN